MFVCESTAPGLAHLRLNDQLIITPLDEEHPMYWRGARTTVEGPQSVIDEATRPLNHLIWPGSASRLLVCESTSSELNHIRSIDQLAVVGLANDHPMYRSGARTRIVGLPSVVDEAMKGLDHLVWSGSNR